ncbi:hypothetical protein ACF1FX_33735 [Streptomyces sp. NPDC014646]|uniref:hypothetical protein n=1 Tax=Streptomyces sp. NPDC014646 TaxID=3364877 RepID=UPI0036F585D6
MNTPAFSARTAGGIFSRLDIEWAALCADTTVQATVADWLMADRLADDITSVTDGLADGMTDRLDCRPGPAELLTAIRTGHSQLADAALRALLRRAATDGRSATLAARVVVQTMIPAAVRITRSQVRPFGGRTFDDIASLTVSTLYAVARSGRIHTRSGRPAANLALDTLRYVFAELAADRETRGEDFAAADDLPDPAPGPAELAAAAQVRSAAAAAGLTPAEETETSSARLELLGLVLDAMETGALSPADGRAIAWHHTATVPDLEAAARAGTTVATWQRRRSRAVARLTASLHLRPAA